MALEAEENASLQREMKLFMDTLIAMATFYAGLYPSRALVKNQFLFQLFEVFNAAGFFISIWMMKILSRGSPIEFTLKPLLPLPCLVYILGIANMFSCSCCTCRLWM
ncbi:hypothetical protein FF1_033694 [Malus domestica]